MLKRMMWCYKRNAYVSLLQSKGDKSLLQVKCWGEILHAYVIKLSLCSNTNRHIEHIGNKSQMYLIRLDKDVKESYAQIVARWFVEKQENKLKDKS
jgi:hypothetical protein